MLPYLFVLLGYVIGATPFGFLAGKMKGIDIRHHGSGNIGATNVLRVLGKPIGLTVFAMDVVKGVVPVLLARIFAGDIEPVNHIPALTVIATILGHNYTFWLHFKGGKGIATSAGALLPLIPFTILAAVVVWAVLFLTTRYVSVGSIAAALTLPTSILIQSLADGNWRWSLLILTAAACALAVYRHKANIQRLMNGTESRFTRKKKGG